MALKSGQATKQRSCQARRLRGSAASRLSSCISNVCSIAFSVPDKDTTHSRFSVRVAAYGALTEATDTKQREPER